MMDRDKFVGLLVWCVFVFWWCGVALVGENLNFVGGVVFNVVYDGLNDEDSVWLRGYALDVSDCDDDRLCFAEDFFYDLSDLRYVRASLYDWGGIYDARETLELRAADCDNFGSAFCGLLKSVGFDCWLEVSSELYHAVAVFEDFSSGVCEMYVVDLTLPGVFLMGCGDDPFSFIFEDDGVLYISEDAVLIWDGGMF